uniref:Kinesin light chain n=1 Tax=Steinernema glaseri TaxID=37863 RepID=A0A1I7YE11_9BILA
MTNLTQEDIVNNTRTVLQGLEALKMEHVTIEENLERNRSFLEPEESVLFDEKLSIIRKNMDTLTLAIDEAQVMIQLVRYTQMLEAENQKLKSMNKSLAQEGEWMRNELYYYREKIKDANQKNAELEEENKHLAFLNTIKDLDIDRRIDEKASTPSEPLADLGFGPEEEDYVQPSASTANSMVASNYEAPNRTRTLQGLVNQYAKNGQYEVAIPLCKQGIEEMRESGVQEHEDMALMLNTLALLYSNLNKHKEAINYLNEALEIREKVYGESNIVVAGTLNNLAVLYGKRRRYKDAEPLCRRALDIKRSCFGDDHPEIAKQLNNLGLLCLSQGKYDEAEECYSKALRIYEEACGPDDPNVAKTKNNLSAAYQKQGKNKAAEEIYKQFLTKAHEKDFGKVTKQNKCIWQIAEEREEKHLRGEHLETDELIDAVKIVNSSMMSTMKNLANVFRAQNKYQAADTLDDVVRRSKRATKSSNELEHSESMTFSRMTTSISTGSLKAKLFNAIGIQK